MQCRVELLQDEPSVCKTPICTCEEDNIIKKGKRKRRNPNAMQPIMHRWTRKGRKSEPLLPHISSPGSARSRNGSSSMPSHNTPSTSATASSAGHTCSSHSSSGTVRRLSSAAKASASVHSVCRAPISRGAVHTISSGSTSAPIVSATSYTPPLPPPPPPPSGGSKLGRCTAVGTDGARAQAQAATEARAARSA
ncbi:hypothetical protein GGR56DRAFT_647266 [Xylariaceae sp. FL0804]|nr:hypothetical protein GGR56DRAFT_647266 [Xylariaceae sp. FL0804]